MEINLYAKESLEPHPPVRERVAEHRVTYREQRNSVSVNDVGGTMGESAGTVEDISCSITDERVHEGTQAKIHD